MQDLWISGIMWDDPLNPELLRRWLDLRQQLPEIESIKIPRSNGGTPTCAFEIHGFSDASKRAFAAGIYLVARDLPNYEAHLLVAKTKVSTIKTLSMLRLELSGAHLLAKLMRAVLDAADLTTTDAYCYTDATIVLNWLSDHPSRWTTFVATRTSGKRTRIRQIWRPEELHRLRFETRHCGVRAPAGLSSWSAAGAPRGRAVLLRAALQSGLGVGAEDATDCCEVPASYCSEL